MKLHIKVQESLIECRLVHADAWVYFSEKNAGITFQHALMLTWNVLTDDSLNKNQHGKD
jgi:hypothetical protein